jgi:hypothetical protein
VFNLLQVPCELFEHRLRSTSNSAKLDKLSCFPSSSAVLSAALDYASVNIRSSTLWRRNFTRPG